MMAFAPDTAIRDAVAALALLPPGSVREIRVPDAGRFKTISGYFNDADAFEKCARYLDRQSYPGIYVTLNPCEPALLARAANRVANYAKNTTSDRDITRREWLLIDVDPKRPAGVSASDDEKAQARNLVIEIRDFLRGDGWPDPALIDSGNGYHLWYRIDLPNDDEALSLIKGALAALASTFDQAGLVAVDTTVSNAARIVKLPGTMSRKGDDLPDRPHRRSAIVEVPGAWAIVSEEQLRSLAAEAPDNGPEPSRAASSRPVTSPRSSRHGQSFDVGQWIEAHGLAVAREGPWKGTGYRWILAACPWNVDHTNSSAFIGRQPSGAIVAGCHHAGCQGKKWHDLRDLVEPDWREQQGTRGGDPDDLTPADVAAEFQAELLVAPEGLTLRRFRAAWWRWEGRCFREASEELLTTQVLEFIVRRRAYKKAKITFARDALAVLKIDTIIPDSLNPPAWLTSGASTETNRHVALANGILDIEAALLSSDDALQPHSPEFFSPVVLPYAFEPAGDCPAWKAVLARIMPDESGQQLLQEYIGYCLLGGLDYPYGLILTGEGANGKSTVLKVLVKLLGQANCSAVPLEQFDVRFALSPMLGKLANIVNEMGEVEKTSEGILKNLISGEPMQFERKFKDPVIADPTAKLVFACNTLPRFLDRSQGIWRRLLILPFEQVIDEAERDLDT